MTGPDWGLPILRGALQIEVPSPQRRCQAEMEDVGRPLAGKNEPCFPAALAPTADPTGVGSPLRPPLSAA